MKTIAFNNKIIIPKRKMHPTKQFFEARVIFSHAWQAFEFGNKFMHLYIIVLCRVFFYYLSINVTDFNK